VPYLKNRSKQKTTTQKNNDHDEPSYYPLEFDIYISAYTPLMIKNDSMSDSHGIDRRYGVDFVAGYDVYRRYYEVNFMVHVMCSSTSHAP
jgi:hypothetical protein